MSAASGGNVLSIGDIQAAPDSPHVPDWETVDRLVGALRGQPEVFRPLWDPARAAHHRDEPPSTPSSA